MLYLSNDRHVCSCAIKFDIPQGLEIHVIDLNKNLGIHSHPLPLLHQFNKWTDSQRKKVLTDVLEKCNVGQLHLVNELVKMRLPVESKDFSRVLPRALNLYIFSFLDPRSLCRCSQVGNKFDFVF